jgi:lipoyl(octanoyl) transferase
MIAVERWGTIPFDEAWKRQRELAFRVESGAADHTLVLCQHPSVITIGRNGTAGNVVADADLLQASGIDVVEIDRGGDVTLHNPGQLVGYPIFNLTTMKPDLHWYLRTLEEAIGEAVGEFGISTGPVHGLTGVWVEESRKICAIGIHCRKWITYHGFALNVVNDLREFDLIVPCGITDKAVTSVRQEMGESVEFDAVEKAVENRILNKFSELWN